MIERGVAWQMLRQKALDAIPAGTFINKGSPPLIESWLKTGAFSVNAASTKGFELDTAAVEVAAALLSEASFLLDHAAEHSATIRNQLSLPSWYSPAWISVTLYYWAFFSLQAITRLIGATPIWLEKPAVKDLLSLAGGSSNSPGAGPYLLSVTNALSASTVRVELLKAKNSRVHDLLWRRALGLCVEWSKVASPTSQEARLYGAISLSVKKLGDVWPSELRNAVNYAPGCAYKAVRKEPQVASYAFLPIDPASSATVALERLEDNVARLTKGGLAANLSSACRILVDLALIFDAISRELYSEVINRRNLDRRWLNARAQFFRERFRGYNTFDWPFAA